VETVAQTVTLVTYRDAEVFIPPFPYQSDTDRKIAQACLDQVTFFPTSTPYSCPILHAERNHTQSPCTEEQGKKREAHHIHLLPRSIILTKYDVSVSEASPSAICRRDMQGLLMGGQKQGGVCVSETEGAHPWPTT
jgi:hypothetical protein